MNNSFLILFQGLSVYRALDPAFPFICIICSFVLIKSRRAVLYITCLLDQ